MMASDFIVDVTEADFEYEVIAYSQKVPVVVDFWAEWCAPCRMLGPMLENLAQEAQGGFRLAKLNVDENPNLALRFGVHSIPAVKAFRNGEMVADFVGVQPEPRLREFLRSIAPSKSDLELEKGLSLLEMGNPQEAREAFNKVVENEPENTTAMLGLAKSYLILGNFKAGHALLTDFPASREYNSAEMLHQLSNALIKVENEDPFDSDDDLHAAYTNAMRLVERGNIEAAMDGLLGILRENKDYRDGEVRQVLLGLFELLGDTNPITRQYRNELASVLF
jgi:putative thioredoxin